jgi:hypothetical protein
MIQLIDKNTQKATLIFGTGCRDYLSNVKLPNDNWLKKYQSIHLQATTKTKELVIVCVVFL